MNLIKYEDLIDRKIKVLSTDEKKEVFNFIEFISMKKLKRNDAFLSALKESQAIGKKLGVTPRDIAKEIKLARKGK